MDRDDFRHVERRKGGNELFKKKVNGLILKGIRCRSRKKTGLRLH